MPFTFSHPALVLPFSAWSRRYTSITGLVIGSIAPDFEYFLLMQKGITVFSHSLPSLLYFNLPLGLLLAFLFHVIIRKPLVQNLPTLFFRRFAHLYNFDWVGHFRTNWWVVMCSILLGALSHLAWDTVTHSHGDYFFRHQEDLVLFDKLDNHQRIYISIHLLHSLIGMAALVAAFFRQPITTESRTSRPSFGFWATFIVLTSVIFAYKYSLDQYHYVQKVAVVAIAALMLALLLTSLLFNFKRS